MAKNVKDSARPLDIDGEEERGAERTAPAVDRDGRPYCALHNCAMVASGGTEVATYYRCQVAGCSQKAKRLRGVVPRAPTLCPQRSCQPSAPGQTAPALEVVASRSSTAQLVMACPQCGFEVLTPRPGARFEPAPVRSAADDLSAR